MECIIKPVICDVFVSNSASGNPAAVVELDAWISDNELLNITKTLKQPITAFVVNDLDTYYIRWFSLSGRLTFVVMVVWPQVLSCSLVIQYRKLIFKVNMEKFLLLK